MYFFFFFDNSDIDIQRRQRMRQRSHWRVSALCARTGRTTNAQRQAIPHNRATQRRRSRPDARRCVWTSRGTHPAIHPSTQRRIWRALFPQSTSTPASDRGRDRYTLDLDATTWERLLLRRGANCLEQSREARDRHIRQPYICICGRPPLARPPPRAHQR